MQAPQQLTVSAASLLGDTINVFSSAIIPQHKLFPLNGVTRREIFWHNIPWKRDEAAEREGAGVGGVVVPFVQRDEFIRLHQRLHSLLCRLKPSRDGI